MKGSNIKIKIKKKTHSWNILCCILINGETITSVIIQPEVLEAEIVFQETDTIRNVNFLITWTKHLIWIMSKTFPASSNANTTESLLSAY